jgi:hypothetical protein
MSRKGAEWNRMAQREISTLPIRRVVIWFELGCVGLSDSGNAGALARINGGLALRAGAPAFPASVVPLTSS